jgi:tetratricopeptide (TPR) repeat protein
MLGNLHSKAKRFDEAVKAYQQALGIDAEHQGAAFSLALAYKQLGRLADAEAGFERVRALDPKSGKTDWQIADIQMQRGNHAVAVSVLEAALKDKKVDRPSFLIKLGEAEIEQRRYADAERHLREALAARPDAALVHYDLGLIAEAQGDMHRAMTEYELEVRRASPSYRASFNFAKLLSKAGRGQEAVVQFRNAVGANPQFAAGYLYLGKALLDTGDLAASEEAVRRGMASNPEPEVAPLAHYVLADVYARQGRDKDARRESELGQKLEHGR